MSTDPQASQDRINKLKPKLKKWEYSFVKTHGHKPTDADIAADAAIVLLYKEYNRLHKELKKSKQPKKPSSSATAPTNMAPPITPSKRNKHAPPPPQPPGSKTPNRSTKDDAWGDGEVYESPASVRRQRLFGNHIARDAVGPTPQKTGKVLGIFESFIDVSATPTKSTGKKRPGSSAGTTATATATDIFGTPTKRNADRISASPATNTGGEDTDRFTTPRKRKRGDLSSYEGGSPLKKDIFNTPSGLKRWAPAPDAEELTKSPPVFRPPPRPKRGLSSLVAELRKMEEEQFNDEEDVMREMEAEAEGQPLPMKPMRPISANPVAVKPVGMQPPSDHDDDEGTQKPKTGKDGFDHEPELPPLPPGAWVEEHLIDENEGKVVEGRTWKKKGLKRQTKRVKMRPVTVKASKVPGVEDEESEGEEEEEVSDYEDGDSEGNATKRAKKAADKDVSTAKDDTGKGKEKGKSIAKKGKEAVKKVVRKISNNAHSHMNFRKLNIKNKNSKGKGGGRFGRRR